MIQEIIQTLMLIKYLNIILILMSMYLLSSWAQRSKERKYWSISVFTLLLHFLVYTIMSQIHFIDNNFFTHDFFANWSSILRFHTCMTIFSLILALNSLNGKLLHHDKH